MRTLDDFELAAISGGDNWGSEAANEDNGSYGSYSTGSSGIWGGSSGGYSTGSSSSGSSSSTMSPAQAQSCAQTIMFWGGVGSGLGAISSGFIGFFGGAAIGGYYGTKTNVCQP
jgi:hypothetical protein